MRKVLFVVIALLWANMLIADDNYLKELEKKAGEGDSYSQYELGTEYLNGTSVKQDYSEAMKWLKRAAEQKNSEAYYLLGNMYANGTGVTVNNSEAVKWYRLAAEADHAEGQRTLGSIYQYGLYGVPNDLKEAAKWLSKVAVSSGNNSTKMELAEIYYGLKEYDKAIEIYKSVMIGYEPYVFAAAKLAEIYYKGQGTKPDYKEAYYYWNICKKTNMSVDKKMSFTGKINKKDMTGIEAKAEEFVKNYEMNMGRGGD